MSIVIVETVAEFAAEISKTPIRQGCVRFFRGHSDYKTYKIQPSVYRNSLRIRNEKELIREAVIRCSQEFPNTMSFFEVLVKLQHYGLPTRLLDVTGNALAALYFGCRDNDGKEGEVLVFDVPKQHVKYYDSDTVSVIANVARRDKGFDLDKLPRDKDEFNKDQDQVGRLLHDIRADKPAFRPIIEPSDLARVIAVRAKLDNARITRQEGAFLLFGINGNKEQCAPIPQDWIVYGNDDRRIIFHNKHGLKSELAHFGVSEQSLFPELDVQTKEILAHFGG